MASKKASKRKSLKASVQTYRVSPTIETVKGTVTRRKR